MDKPQFIYVLRDPRTKEIRYVGKSVDPFRRRKGHLYEGHGGFHNRAKREWTEELRAQNIRPDVEILEECTLENWRNRETYWIERLRAEGKQLLNLSIGGNGTGFQVGRKQSDETKNKLREANKRQFQDEAMRQRHSDGVRDWHRNLPTEVRDRLNTNLGKGRELGPPAAKCHWEGMTDEQKKDQVRKMQSWRKGLSQEEFNEIQRQKILKGWAKRPRNIGPLKEEHKQKVKEKLLSFWSGKTKEERREIALRNWEKRRAKP